jgi:hypothetical protein
MKLTLSTLIALALSGALLSGCDRPAGTGNQSSSGATSGAASGGTTPDKKQSPSTAPKSPSGSPSSPSGSSGTK